MTSSTNKPATSMAELMAKHGESVQPLTKGATVKGKITSINAGEIIMTLDNKTDVVVLEKDRRLHKQLMNSIKVGDSVEATVISIESEFGYPLVSLRHSLGEKMWEHLEKLKKSGEKMTVTVTELTKGGFVVEAEDGTEGFLPNSHMKTAASSDSVVGKQLQASIAEVSRENRKVIFSQKGSLTEDDFKTLAQMYKKDQKVSGTISGITTFGLFVSLPFKDETVDGLVHISEIAWEKVDDLSQLFTVGQKVDAVVIGMDSRSKRIDLSIKRLTQDPFAEIVKQFEVDKKVTGTVTEVNDMGVTLSLGKVGDNEVEGMIKKEKISPNTTYAVGDSVKATVVSVDSRKRKVMLTPVLTEKPLMYR